jgi:lysozyme family protein
MKTNFDQAFAKVIAHEGGYVNDHDDHGGETNLGVTKAAWAAYLGRAVLDGEMKAITVNDVKPFYKSMYWDRIRGDDLPAGVDYAAFDFAVNAGVKQSAKFLQRAVGATADGVIGPATLGLIKGNSPQSILDSFTQQKEDFYRGIVARDASQQKFIKGWMSRVASVQTTAAQMLA